MRADSVSFRLKGSDPWDLCCVCHHSLTVTYRLISFAVKAILLCAWCSLLGSAAPSVCSNKV